jgi:hypothetical protein
VPPASRIQLVPPAAWDEAKLLDAARALSPQGDEVRPGDAMGELVVLRVEPQPGSSVEEETEIEILPAPRAPDAPLVDLVVLVDVGASMQSPWDARHDRAAAARAALASFLQAPSATVASLTVYEYGKELRLVAGPAPPREIALDAPTRPKGPSRTGAAIDHALADLAERARPDRAQAVLLLTDGIGSVGELVAAAERAGRLSVPIHALVFAPDLDAAFEALAMSSRGSVQKATHPLTIEFVHVPGAGP